MVNQKESIKMNMISGYIDRSVSRQVSLHIRLEIMNNYEAL